MANEEGAEDEDDTRTPSLDNHVHDKGATILGGILKNSIIDDDDDDDDKVDDDDDKEDDDFDDANSNVNSANKQQRVATRS